MLGKVFEELVTGRHESGSYYTPQGVGCEAWEQEINERVAMLYGL